MKQFTKSPSSWTKILVAPCSSAWKNIVVILFLLFGMSLTSFSQIYQWVYGFGGGVNDRAKGVTLDNSNNIYITGKFCGDVDFDPGYNIHQLISTTNYDIFLAKYDPSGNYLWAKSFGNGITGNEGISVAVDSSNNVYMTGYISGTMDFDPGPGVANINAGIFLAKYDSLGNYVWARYIGVGTPTKVYIDHVNNIYVTGSYPDFLLAKYDIEGNCLWTNIWGGNNSDQINSIEVDVNGDIYLCGYFSGAVDFDPGPGVVSINAGNSYDIFLAKYDPSGNYLWANTFGSVGYSSQDEAYGLSLDESNNIYITGRFMNTMDFDPGPGVANFVSNGYNDIFLAKYDPSGNYLWANTFGSPGIPMDYDSGQDWAYDVVTDNLDNVYITGRFMDTVDFDPGLDVKECIAYGNHDIFIAKYDSSGNYIWARSFGSYGSSYTEGYDMIIDYNNNMYIVGKYTHNLIIDPQPNISNFVPAAGENILFLKINQKINIQGKVYQDLNENCLQGSWDLGIANITLKIMPGGHIVETDSLGIYSLDSLSIGNYTVTIDTVNPLWLPVCFITQNFSVINTNVFTQAPEFGMASQLPEPIYLEWQNCYGGTINDHPYAMELTSDGGYVVAGMSSSNNGDVSGNHGSTDMWIVKIDSTGNLQWQKCFGGSDYEYLYGMSLTQDGGYVFIGQTSSNNGDVSGNHGAADMWIVKIDSIGNLQWQKCFGGSGDDIGRSIIQIADGGYVFTGETSSNNGDVSGNHGGKDIWIVKIDSIGNLQWQKSFGGDTQDGANKIQKATDGGYIIAGSTYSNNGDVSGNHGDNDVWIVKIDSIGNLQWQKCFGGPDYDAAYDILQTSDGGYIFTGSAESNGGNIIGCHGGDIWIVKIDSIGNLQWQKCFGGSLMDIGTVIKKTQNNEYIVAASVVSNDEDIFCNHGGGDFWIFVFEEWTCSNSATVNVSICDGESYFVGGSLQTVGGIYHDTLLNVFGCDSIVITYLTVNPNYIVDTLILISLGDSIFVAGGYQNQAGIYLDTLETIHGCDSIIITTLEIITLLEENVVYTDDIYIYPNPAQESITIETTEIIVNVSCYNLMGQLFLETQDKVLNISNLSVGTYLVRVMTENGVFSKKLIVQ